jgi:hypothetical protein
MQLFLVQGYPVGPYDFGSRPDQGLPGYGHPGNRPPGSWGGPVDPGWGGGGAPHPGNRPPGSWGGHPDQGLPGGPPDHAWRPGHRPPMPGQGLPPEFGGHPDQGLPGSGGHPSHQPIVPGATPYGTAIATKPPEKVDAENGAWVLVDVQGALVWAWAQKPAAPDQTLPPGGTAQPKK